MKCAINEIFGPTIQGEGLCSGVPSIFIRFNGCNLRCCFKGGSICDTAYTSHRPEEPAFNDINDAIADVKTKLKQNPHVEDIVFTGGEPMLQQEAMASIIDELDKCYKRLRYTVETNGTIPLKEVLKFKVDLWSVSPKLSNSAYFEGCGIDSKMQERHNAIRVNYEAVCTYFDDAPTQLKFVYTDSETEAEIKKWLKGLHDTNSYTNVIPTLIMPEGEVNEQISRISEDAVQACIRNGWRFCDRVHIRIWGNKRAV